MAHLKEFKYKKSDLERTYLDLDTTSKMLHAMAIEIKNGKHDIMGFADQLKSVNSDVSKILIDYCDYTKKAIDKAESK